MPTTTYGRLILLILLSTTAVLISCASTSAPSQGAASSATNPAADAAPAVADSGPSPVSLHGALSISGTKMVGADGQGLQLRGFSLFWSQWGGQFFNAKAVAWTHEAWGATVVRAAMGIEQGGYLANPEVEKARVKAVVEAAVASGIYVIIDWHDHNAEQHGAEAVAFFAEMAQAYKDTPNVLFEIYNEPLDSATWAEVKAYALPVVKAIRDAGANNVILVGSPHWSQDVHSAAADPIKGYANIAYSLHFYASSHRKWLRDRAEMAMDRGIALFVSEWGTCNASGDGGFDAEASDEWLAWMDAKGISWCNWSLNDKAETASALKPGSGVRGGWADSRLTESGRYVVQKIRAAAGAAR